MHVIWDFHYRSYIESYTLLAIQSPHALNGLRSDSQRENQAWTDACAYLFNFVCFRAHISNYKSVKEGKSGSLIWRNNLLPR